MQGARVRVRRCACVSACARAGLLVPVPVDIWQFLFKQLVESAGDENIPYMAGPRGSGLNEKSPRGYLNRKGMAPEGGAIYCCACASQLVVSAGDKKHSLYGRASGIGSA